MTHRLAALLILLSAAALAPGHPSRAWAGDTPAEDAAEEAAKAAEQAAEEAAEAAEEAAEEAARAAEEAAEEAARQAEEAAEQAAEEAEQAAEQAAQAAAEQAEDAAEEAAQAAEDAAEDAAKAAEDAAEDAADAAEDAAEDAAKAAEDAAEDAAKAAEEAAEDAAESAEDAAEDAAKSAEDAAEEAAESAEDAAEDAAESAEDAAQSAEDAADEAADDAEDAADEAEDAADDVEDAAEEAEDAENALQDDSADAEDELDGDDDSGSDDDDARDDDTHHDVKGGSSGKNDSGGRVRGAGDRPTSGAPVAEAFAGSGLDDDGNEIALGEWLVIATPDEVHRLEQLGYLTRSIESLQGLGRVVARMEAPASFDLAAARDAIERAAPGAEADFNHLYRAEGAPGPAAGRLPAEVFPSVSATGGEGLRIGVIDTAADLHHPALANARLQVQDFVNYSGERPEGHGTAVASLLVGQDAAHRGLLPRAELYLASVFFVTAQGASTATTLALVRALDWMAGNAVPVVNMSLAGPPNDILQNAIARSRELGMVVVAAVGNRGPGAAPLYPAAYPSVVAVTAVDAQRRVYRLANRGEQVDFAAPGVGVLHAAAGRDDYTSSSGTSMAAPFVTAVISAACNSPGSRQACLLRLRADAEDIGAPGFDPLYGYGLIRPLRS